MDFVTVLTGVASAIAVATAIAAAWRFGRRWLHRRRLREMTERLETLADEVKSTAVEIDHRHSEGAGWTGWHIWPDPLVPHLQLLDSVVTESEGLTAEARGMATDATLDRLRADVENASVYLRTGADLYRAGTITNYRREQGIPIPPGINGQDTTAALTAETRDTLDGTRRTFTLLIRTCLYQLGEDDEARSTNPRVCATSTSITRSLVGSTSGHTDGRGERILPRSTV